MLLNSVSVGYTHYGTAPDYLTLYTPIFLSIVCIIRSTKWIRFRHQKFTLEQAQHQIKMTVLFAFIMAVAFSAWGFSLYRYGNLLQQGHVAYFMSVTVIGIIVCLIHLPAAALTLISTVVVAFVLFFVSSGNSIFIAISINFFLVCIVLIFVALSYYRAFSGIIYSKLAFEKKHQEAQQLNFQNEKLANEDGLTKLANRRSFFKRLTDTIENHNSNDIPRRFIVCLLDLDGFKPINDLHGHTAGDKVLIEVSHRLAATIKEPGVLARIGGDEFAIIIDLPLTEDEIKSFGERLSESIRIHFKMRTGIAQISVSCGFSIFPDAGSTPELLMDRADFALYHAKEFKRGSSVIFSAEHEQLIKRDAQIEQALRGALLENELQLYYQPIVNGSTGETIGLEALARWHHKTLGKIPPDQFIPIAEKMGCICEITSILLEKAVVDATDWPDNVFLSFNLSALDITNSQSLKNILNIIKAHHISSHKIQFEITETAIMNDLSTCAKIINTLQQSGFKIALDDFGSGYSSLGYIHKLSFDKLKIDRCFITSLTNDPRSQRMTKTILEMCHNLEVDCIAEGVETKEQKDILLNLGCINMQGYYFSRPKPLLCNNDSTSNFSSIFCSTSRSTSST